jgi:major membrane immunogen (membrane-anchored lipoprotein)
MKKALIIVSAAFLLVACGESPQTNGGAKQDAGAYTGTGKAYVEPGWKSGDKASWESKLKARGQYGQNEYNRVN